MISQSFKESLANVSFEQRTLEPESMEETAEDYAGMDFRESNSAFIEWMSPMIPKGGWVADFGCGPGDLSIILAEARPDLTIIGVDFSSAMLDIAKERSKGNSRLYWKLGNMTEAVLPEGEIDFVFSHAALHHLPRLNPFFVQMKKALQPRGGFCIRDLRRPQTAAEAMEWIDEATQNKLTERQYELFFYSLRASLTLGEVRQELQGTGIRGRLEIPATPKRYWVFYRRFLRATT